LASLLVGVASPAALATPAGAALAERPLARVAAVAAPAPGTPATASPSGPAEVLRDVRRFRWEKRLVFVFADDAGTAAAAGATLAEAEAEAGIEDRHVLWFVVRGDVVVSNFGGTLDPRLAATLRADYLPGTEPPPVAVVLVGKDGGVKYRATGLDLNDIFREIDGMPMRRREMRSNW
jgi:hypothetical protein